MSGRQADDAGPRAGADGNAAVGIVGAVGPGQSAEVRRPGRAARRRARRPAPPLPMRNGLSPTRWAVPAGAEPAIALDALAARFPALLDPAATPLPERFARGEIVRADRRPWSASDLAGPTDELWFQRELRPEHVPDAPLPNLLQDDHLLVIDKPHDVATMPRGAHVLASALVRLRAQTGIESLAPLHRLDRRTAGVLAFGIQPQERAAYQQLFARGEVRKEYRAIVLPGQGQGQGRVRRRPCPRSVQGRAGR